MRDLVDAEERVRDHEEAVDDGEGPVADHDGIEGGAHTRLHQGLVILVVEGRSILMMQ